MAQSAITRVQPFACPIVDRGGENGMAVDLRSPRHREGLGLSNLSSSAAWTPEGIAEGYRSGRKDNSLSAQFGKQSDYVAKVSVNSTKPVSFKNGRSHVPVPARRRGSAKEINPF